MKLSPSTNKRYPTSKGWFTFVLRGWRFYISLIGKHVRMFGVHGRKIYGATMSRVGVPVRAPVRILNGMILMIRIGI